MKTPNFRVLMQAKGKARVEIYDVLGPSWAGMIDVRTVSQALRDAGDVSEIELRVNSPGGSAFEGLAIANLLRDHPAKVTAVVDGVAASAASVLVMGADTIRMPKNALMMIHDPATIAWGMVDDLQKAIQMLQKTKDAAVETYVRKSKKAPQQIAQWMKDETWFTGAEAVAAGLADETDADLSLPPTPAPQNFGDIGFRRAPAQFLSLVAMTATPTPEGSLSMTTPTPAPAPAASAPANHAPAPQNAASTAPPNPAPANPAPTNAAPVPAVDLATERDAAAAAEQTRATTILSLCETAGHPELASKFLADRKTTVEDVRLSLFNQLCRERPPVGEGGGGEAKKTDPEQAFKAEYAAEKELYTSMGLTEEQYVASRKKDR